MKRPILILAILLSASCSAQILRGISQGASTVAGTTVTYAGTYFSGAGTTPVAGTFVSGTPSAGQAVVGVAYVPNADTVSTICDGTSTGGCTGSSTYTLRTADANGTSFKTVLFYTCNFQGSTNITVVFTGGGTVYVAGVVATGNSTTSCSDGIAFAERTSAGTVYSTANATSGSLSVTTTNAHDLLIGLFVNNTGGSNPAFTAGTDSQGNTMVIQVPSGSNGTSGVLTAETFNETATNTYAPTITGPSSIWNGYTVAIK